MIPELRIGGISIETYWIMYFVGTVSMYVLMLLRKSRFGLGYVKAAVFTILLTVCGLLGTKVLYVLENLQSVIANGLSLGGVSFFGAVYLVPLLMIPFGKLFSLRGKQTTDACALCVLSMIGFMRFGCFFSGCCGGIEATVLGMSFVWPTQALESIGDFVILAILWKYENQNRFAGGLYPLFMIFYSVMRFFIEFMRDTEKNLLYMSHGQWFSLVAIMAGLIWLAALGFRGNVHENVEKT